APGCHHSAWGAGCATPRSRDTSFLFRAGDGIRAGHVTGVQTCALPIYRGRLKQRQKDFAAAEDAFSEALSRNPKSSSALIGRGRSEERRVGKESRSRRRGSSIQTKTRSRVWRRLA